MASGGPAPPQGQATPQQLAQMAQMQAQMAAEAKKRGLTPQQFQEQQKKALEAEAAKRGLAPQEYFNQLRQQAIQQAQMQQQMRQQQQAQQQQPQQQGQTVQQQVPVNPGVPAKPEAVAVAKFLTGQNLKSRTCILDGQRKEMFKVKRALRALQSPAYAKAHSKKNSLLPEVKDEATAKDALRLLPLSMLALRVTKGDPHDGHGHEMPKKDPKRIKGLWTVKVERNQEFEPLMHYVWLYEGPQWKQKAMAVGALVAIIAVVMFPLWPLVLRQGVWYLSAGMIGLLGLFFAMALFRLVLFCVTVFIVPPGLWLYPNLFEDVGFFDSFKPLWGWHEDKQAKKQARKAKKAAKAEKAAKKSGSTDTITPKATDAGTSATTTASQASPTVGHSTHRAPQVEEAQGE